MATPPIPIDHDPVSPEHAQFEAALDKSRAALLGTLEGLSEEQVRRRLVPSLTTLLGLIKHATYADTVWFQSTLVGVPREELGLSRNIDDSFRVTDSDTIESVSIHFSETVEASRRIASRYDLDYAATHHRQGAITLRQIYLHMIAEIARHAGHADILREQILAADQTNSEA